MRVVLAVLVAFALTSAARSEDGSTRLPFTPFSGASEGDYSIVSVGSETLTTRVLAVTSAAVTVERNGRRETVATDVAPTVSAFFGRWSESRLSAWRVIDDTLDLGGLEIAAKRLTFSVRARGEQASVTVFFSSQVGGDGIALVRVRYHEAEGDRTTERRVIEFGDRRGPRFGGMHREKRRYW
jgi:hypothetical protein